MGRPSTRAPRMYFKEENEARAERTLVEEIGEFIYVIFGLQLLSEDWHRRDSRFFFLLEKPSHLSMERSCSRPLHESTLYSLSKTFLLYQMQFISPSGKSAALHLK